MAEENPGKPQLGDHVMIAMQPVIASNGIPYLQNDVGRISLHVREGEVREEGKNGEDIGCITQIIQAGYFSTLVLAEIGLMER